MQYFNINRRMIYIITCLTVHWKTFCLFWHIFWIMGCWILCVYILVLSLCLGEVLSRPITEGYVPCESNDALIIIPPHLRSLLNVTNLCLIHNSLTTKANEYVTITNLEYSPPKSRTMSKGSVGLICIITLVAICVFAILFRGSIQAIIKRLRKWTSVVFTYSLWAKHVIQSNDLLDDHLGDQSVIIHLEKVRLSVAPCWDWKS